MNTKNISATKVRVDLTGVISELDSNNRVSITKHGKVIAYLTAHVEEEARQGVPTLSQEEAENIEKAVTTQVDVWTQPEGSLLRAVLPPEVDDKLDVDDDDSYVPIRGEWDDEMFGKPGKKAI